MNPSTLQQLLVDQLRNSYDAEKQLVEALPKMAAAATGNNLKQSFLNHLEETKGHATRLEKALVKLGVSPEPITCRAMQALVEEGSNAIKLPGNGTIRDVALIGAARKVEHYEMAAYKAMRGIATAVDQENVADLLQQTIDEECNADKTLCTLADLVTEAAKDSADDTGNATAKPTPRKPPGKKKQK